MLKSGKELTGDWIDGISQTHLKEMQSEEKQWTQKSGGVSRSSATEDEKKQYEEEIQYLKVDERMLNDHTPERIQLAYS